MNKEQKLEEYRRLVEPIASHSQLNFDLVRHGWNNHTEMVNYYGMMLSEEEPVDLQKNIILACHFHDIGRLTEDSDPEHAKRGAEIAKKIIPIHFPEADIESICWAIANHNLKCAPNGREPIVMNFDKPNNVNGLIAEHLWDADRLDLYRLPRYRPIDKRKLNTKKARDFANSYAHTSAY